MTVQYTEEELLKILVNYNNKIGFPTQRKFRTSNGLPSYTTYVNVFGSFKEAILKAKIKIPKSKERYFNRKEYTKDELLVVFKNEHDKQFSKTNTYINDNDFDTNENLPSASVYYKHFGTLNGIYQAIGLDRKAWQNEQTKNRIKESYTFLKNELGRVPNSRDFIKYSKDDDSVVTMTTIINHYSSLSNLQKTMGDIPTLVGRSITNEEIVNIVQGLAVEYSKTPTSLELDKYPSLPSRSDLLVRFGSYESLLLECGLLKNKRLVTQNGNKALSVYEYKFLLMLEKYNIDFKKEAYYKEYIHNFNKKYRFDFVLTIDCNIYFIEIFGIVGNKNYNKKTSEKIKLCKDNGLKLLSFFGEEICYLGIDEIFDLLNKKILENKGNDMKWLERQTDHCV